MTQPKEARTLQVVQIEIQTAFQEIGFLQFQLEDEIPSEIQKRMNSVHDLQKEARKLKEIEDYEHQKAVDALKAQGNGLKPINLAPDKEADLALLTKENIQ